MIWNLIQDLFPKKKNQKNHAYAGGSPGPQYVIATIRDPRDMLRSRILIRQTKVTLDLIKQEIKDDPEGFVDFVAKNYSDTGFD